MDTGQINPIRNVRFLRPQREWGWEIAIYLYLAGMGAGSFAIGVITNWFGYSLTPSKTILLLGFPLDISKAVLLWGPILVTIGAPFLILDLGIKRRFLYACLNPRTSWVARGFLILSIFIIIGLGILAISILPFQWLNKRTTFWLVLEIVGFLFALTTAIYTGILLKSVKYISFWNTPLLPFLFLISSLSTGSMGIILSILGYGLLLPSGELSYKLIGMLTGTEQILILIEAFALGLYLFYRYRTREQGESSVRVLISGDLRFIFWVGIIFSGFIFPIILEYLYSQFPGYPVLLFATGIFLLVGGFFLRFGILIAGIKDQLPMHRFIEIQYNLRASKKNIV